MSKILHKSLFLLFISLAFGFAKPLVSVSVPPQKYFVEKIAANTLDINVIIPAGTDEHNFDFKPATMKKLEKSDIYFTIGLEFEKPMLYKFKDLFKNLQIVDTRANIKALYTSAENDYDDGEHDKHAEHKHEHGEHSHKHTPAVFKESQVKNRTLSDYAGEFQSVYSLLKDGSLDDVFYFKALNTEKTAKDIKQYYEIGYKSDIDKIIISKDSMTFIKGKEKLSGSYAYKGFKIFTYKSGKMGVRYQFENTDKGSKAPKFVQFSDHNIEPTKTSHFHIFFGDESFEKLNKEMDNWPTFYTASMKKEQIIEDLIAHIDLGNDPHIWLDPILVKIQASTIAKALIAKYPQHKALYEANLAKFQAELDALNAEISALFEKSKNKKFIIYHPSLAYFAARYHLVQIPVEIEGKEPKTKDLQRLISVAKKENIKTIFVQKGFSQNSVKSLVKELKASVVELNHLSDDYSKNLLEIAKKIAQ